jgi:hypothetical protein
MYVEEDKAATSFSASYFLNGCSQDYGKDE